MPPIPLPDPELADDTIRLRPPAPEDVDAITEACQDPDIQHFTFVPSPYRTVHAREWIAAAPARRAAGEDLGLVIADARTGALLGTVGLQHPDWQHRTGAIGYWVAPWARGHGAAGRASALLGRWAIRALGLRRVTIDADEANAASRRAAERAGFVLEGVLRSAIEVKGRRWSLATYSLIAEDLGA
ncbi:MAG TPA: GNAT family protein [Baekduia sp.]|nr:GNAT family protein [Baekduia sp.]